MIQVELVGNEIIVKHGVKFIPSENEKECPQEEHVAIDEIVDALNALHELKEREKNGIRPEDN